MKLKKVITILLTGTMMLGSVPGLQSYAVESPSQQQQVNLPPDIKAKKESFDSLNEVKEKYETTYVTQVNNQEKRIGTVNLGITPFELKEGETSTYEIPSDIIRVSGFFDRIDAYGTGFLNVKIYATSPSKPNKALVSSPWKGDTNYQIRPNTFTINHLTESNRGEDAFTGYSFVFEGPVKVDKLVLFSKNGIETTFDTTAWSVLGGDKEILDDISVNVDTTRGLNIEGITTFEEDKFKRLYANPIGEDDGYAVADYFTKKNFMPGRQIYKLRPALEIGYTDGWTPLKEDANRPGYADYSLFDTIYDPTSEENKTNVATFDRYYPSDLNYALCFDNWPSWTWENPKDDKGKGTPAVEKFDAAADLAAKWVKYYDNSLQGRGPKWVEVKNEASISNEWAYHSKPGGAEGWTLLADFHNKVSDAIKAESPEVKVGGPTAAWMALDANHFNEATEQLRFMDNTKDHLDFYSYHFYEGGNLMINDNNANYGGYLGGRLEADLDLFRNHMILTDNVKPLVISETGTLSGGGTDPDFWIKLKNFNSLMVRYANRPNEFEMVVPFLLPIMWWAKDDPQMLMSYDENGNPSELTKIKYFIEQWDEYKGDLLPVFSNNDKIYTHSVQNGNVIYVAVNNMNAQRALVDLNLNLNSGNSIEKIERTTTYLDLGKLYFEDNVEMQDLDDIRMHVEETSIFKITLKDVPVRLGEVKKVTSYGDAILQPTGNDASFTINCPLTQDENPIEKSILRVCLGRENGFSQDLTVKFNDLTYTYDMSFTNKPDRYFGYVDFEIPTDAIQASNQVVVTMPEEEGKITSTCLINYYGASTAPDVNADVMLALPKIIAGTNGTEFNVTLSVNTWPTTDSKMLEGILTVPQGVELVSMIPSDALTGGTLNYNLDNTGKLRFVYMSEDFNTITLNGELLPSELFTAHFRLKEDIIGSNQLAFFTNSLVLRTKSEVAPTVFDVSKANGLISIIKPEGNFTVSARLLYLGDDIDLIPSNKQAVALEVTNLAKQSKIMFQDVEFYYSEELSTKKGTTSYVAVMDNSITLEALNDAKNYIIPDETYNTITFGDTNEDSIINAQDALNTLSLWLRKTEITTDKEILINNVTADSRIDTIDVLAIMEKIVDGKEFAVLSK